MVPAISSGVAIRPSGTAAVSSAWRLSLERRRHVGLDRSGGDDVDRDAPRAELPGQRSGEADEAGLRRGVVRLAGRAEQPDHRRHQHDAPLAGPQHPLRGALGDPVGSGEVGVDHAREVVLGHAQQQPVAGGPGVGDEHLDRPAELLLDRRERLVDVAGRRHVALDAEQPVGRVRRSVGDRDPVAAGGEASGDGEADASRPARDENDASAGHAPVTPPQLDDRAGRRHAGAEADEQQQVALLHAVVLDGVDEGQRDRRRRRVAGPLEHDRGPVHADAEAVAGGGDDPRVRLVGHDQGDVVGGHAGVGHRLLAPSRP